MHLVLDVRCRRGLTEVSVVSDLVGAIVDGLGLKLRHLHVQEFPREEVSGPGVSAVGMLSESHVNVHTWPETGVVQLCVQSCRGFMAREVMEAVNKLMGIDEVLTEHVIDRPEVKV